MEKGDHCRKLMHDLMGELAEDLLNEVVPALAFVQMMQHFVQETHGGHVQLLEIGREIAEVLHDVAMGHHVHIQERF